MNKLTDQVTALMRQVAADIIMPRYRNLAQHEVAEKSAGEHVTIADQESELRLSEGLASILPDAGIVGEEACDDDPCLIGKLASGLNWLIDPIDGTSNFASGTGPFGVMIALVSDGDTQMSWILDPVSGRLCHAERGKGATLNGARVSARESGAPLPIAGLSLLFVDPDKRQALKDRAEGKLQMVDIPRCAAEQYPRIVLGQNDVAFFERTLAWDHAAGVLFTIEAGGHVARPDGSAYRPDQTSKGMLAAASVRMWDKAADALYR